MVTITWDPGERNVEGAFKIEGYPYESEDDARLAEAIQTVEGATTSLKLTRPNIKALLATNFAWDNEDREVARQLLSSGEGAWRNAPLIHRLESKPANLEH